MCTCKEEAEWASESIHLSAHLNKNAFSQAGKETAPLGNQAYIKYTCMQCLYFAPEKYTEYLDSIAGLLSHNLKHRKQTFYWGLGFSPIVLQLPWNDLISFVLELFL